MGNELSRFMRRFMRAVEAEVQVDDGVTTLRLPRQYWKRLGGVHQFTTDLEVFDQRDGEIELLSLGSNFIQTAIKFLEEAGAVGQLRTAEVDVPATLLYYRYYIETLRSEVEAFASVTVSDNGDVVAVAGGLQRIPDGEPVTPSAALAADVWEAALERGRFEVGSLIVPALQEKREEAADEMRRAEKRLEKKYQRLIDETRKEEARLRRKLGEIRNRLYFTEDGVRERKLEGERDKVMAQLHDLKFRNNRREEQLEQEYAERMTREKEKHEPRLVVELVGATRLFPPADGKRAAGATNGAKKSV
jgi:hypothetical protein